MLKKKTLVGALKLFIVVAVAGTTFSLAYYAPAIPPILKPLVPIHYRWTTEEIVRQIQEQEVDRDFLAYFERDPERRVPNEPRIIVAPADGQVKVIREMQGRKRIVIYMSVWDVHIQRVPLEGPVVDVAASHHENQEEFKCDRCPQNVTQLATGIGTVTVKQVTSGLATRVQTFLKKGQTVRTGERLGFIFLGSHTVVDLPAAASLKVRVGDRVFGGETIIARY
jgi:phosphatidylserine decarboxylase